MNKILSPLGYYPDPTKSLAVSEGTIYIGVPDLDPEVPANQKTVYCLKECGLQQEVTQPIQLSKGGVPLFNGSPVSLFVSGDYSMRVLDKNGTYVYYVPNSSLTDATEVYAYDTVAHMKATTIGEGELIRTKGYYAEGDGGQATYLTKTAAEYGGTPDEYGDHTLDNGNIAVLQYSGIINVKWFGAKGDGVTEDTSSIEAASVNGEVVYFPNGTYLTSSISPTDGWFWKGEDKSSTIIKLKNNINNHLISLTSNISFHLSNITLNCNRTNQTAGHGIRLGGTDDVSIINVHIQSPYSYGIGMQAGTNKNIIIDKLSIEDSGQDGIDIKDYDLANENIRLSNIFVKNYGQLTTGQAAVDVRGPVTLIGLKSISNIDDTRSFRFRASSSQGREGSGTITNIHHIGNGGTGSYAIQISENVNRYTISDVYCENTNLIIVFESGAGGVVNNVSGLDISGDAFSMFGNGTRINNITIENCSRFVDIESGASNNSITNFTVSGISGSDWARVQGSTDTTKFIIGSVTSGKTLNDGVTDTTVKDVVNYKTSTKLISEDLLVDSTATRTFTLAHGLPFTPSKEDITLTLHRSTGNPTDYRIGLLHIDDVNSTNVVGRVVITTASGTSGAAIKASVTIKSKNS